MAARTAQEFIRDAARSRSSGSGRSASNATVTLNSVLGGQSPASGSVGPARDAANQSLNRLLASAAPQSSKNEARGIVERSGAGLLGALGDLFEVIDTPRRFVVSTVKETGDLLSGEGFSGSDWLRQVDDGINMSDILPDTGIGWLDGAIGFVGDVALDPLTYLAPGSRLVATGARIGSKEVARRLATEGVEKFGKEVADDLARQVTQRGIWSVPREQLAEIGVERGMYWTVPGTGRYGRAAQRAMGVKAPAERAVRVSSGATTGAVANRFAALRQVSRNSAFHQAVSEAISGEMGKLRTIINTSDSATKVVVAQRVLDFAQRARGRAAEIRREFQVELRTLNKAARAAGLDGVTLGNAVREGVDGPIWQTLSEAQRAVVVQASDMTGRWRARLNAEFGDEWLRERDDYVFRTLSEEARKKGVVKGRKNKYGAAFPLARMENRALRFGDTFLGKELVEGAGTVEEQIERIAREAFGGDYVRLLEDDFFKAMDAYTSGVTRRLREKLLDRDLVNARIATVSGAVPDVPVLPDGTINPNHPMHAFFDEVQALMSESGGSTWTYGTSNTAAAAARAYNADAKEALVEQIGETTARNIEQSLPLRETAAVDLATPDVADRVLANISAEASAAAKQQEQALRPTLSRLRKTVKELGDDATADDLLGARGAIDTALEDNASKLRGVQNERRKLRNELNRGRRQRQRRDASPLSKRVTKNAGKKTRERIAELDATEATLRSEADELQRLGRDVDGRIDRFTDPEALAAARRELDDVAAIPATTRELGAQGRRGRSAVRAAAVDDARAVRDTERVLAKTEKERRRLESKVLAPKERRRLEREYAHRNMAEMLFQMAERYGDEANGLRETLRLQAQAQVAYADMLARGFEPMRIDGFSDLLREHREQILYMFNRGLKQLNAGTQAEEWVVDALSVASRMATPEDVGMFAQYFDKFTGWWKTQALLSPGYHVRNFFGGMWNNYLAGVEFGAHVRFWNARRKFNALLAENGGDFERTLQQALLRDDDVGKVAQMFDVGVFANVGRGADELPVTTLGRGVARVKDPIVALQQFGSDQVESVLRGALALDVMSKGGTADQAYEAVIKYHFDYTDLSSTERKIRRAIPFWSFTRRNLPLQIEALFKQPGKVNNYLAFKDNMERQMDAEGIVPLWFSENMAIRMPFTVDGQGIYVMPDLPLKDLRMLDWVGQAASGDFGGAVQNVASMANPFLKTPIEMAMDRQFFNKIPLRQDYVEAPSYLTVIPGMKQALEKLGVLQRHADGGYYGRQEHFYLIDQWLPVAARVRRLLPAEEKYEDRWATSTLAFLFGPFPRTNTETEQKNELYRRSREVERIIADVESLGIEVEGGSRVTFR